MSSKDIDMAAYTKTFFTPEVKLMHMQQMQLGIEKKGIYFDWKFSKLDRWYSPLPWLYEEVKAKTNIPEEKIKIVPVTIDSSRFLNNSISKEQAREKLGLPKDQFLIGYVGRIDSRKRPDLVFKAFESIKKQSLKDDNLGFVVVGERNQGAGDEHDFADKFEYMIQSSDYKSSIHRMKFIKNVQDLFKALDAFVMATDKETFGLVTVEAMATGTIVIGADTGGTYELLDYGNCGFVFKSGDEKSLSESIMRAYNEQDKLDTIRQKARDRVINNFDKKVACQKIAEDLVKALN